MLKNVLARFVFVSGLGWLLDVAITVFLVGNDVGLFFASAIGAATAVTFVYVMSRLGIFADKRLGTAWDYVLYVMWQVLAISVASVLVAWLAIIMEPLAGGLGVMTGDPLAPAAGIAKILVTPLTLTANFMFMNWLTSRCGVRAPTPLNSKELM